MAKVWDPQSEQWIDREVGAGRKDIAANINEALKWLDTPKGREWLAADATGKWWNEISFSGQDLKNSGYLRDIQHAAELSGVDAASNDALVNYARKLAQRGTGKYTPDVYIPGTALSKNSFMVNLGMEQEQVAKGEASTAEADKAAAEEAAAKEAAALAEKRGKERDSITAQIKQFTESMLGPVDPNDPILNSLQNVGMSAARKAAAARGIGGGLSVQNEQIMTQQAALPYLQQRNALGLQGLGLQNQRGIGLEQLQQGWENIGLNAANQQMNAGNLAYQQQLQADQMHQANMLNAYNARVGGAQGLWGTIGGVAGGVLGGMYGGPSGAAAGMQAGSSLGAGLGGLGQGPAPTYQGSARPPSYAPYRPGSASRNQGYGW